MPKEIKLPPYLAVKAYIEQYKQFRFERKQSNDMNDEDVLAAFAAVLAIMACDALMLQHNVFLAKAFATAALEYKTRQVTKAREKATSLDSGLRHAGMTERKCRVCGCTDNDCSGCIEKTGEPCFWVEEDLCSACVPERACPREG